MNLFSFDKVTIFGFNGKEWKRRKSILTAEYLKDRYDIMKPYEQKYNMPHAVIPQGIDPNEETLFNWMQRKTETYIEHYRTDFYYHDPLYFFEHKREVIWLIRKSGTNIFSASLYDDQEHKEASRGTLEYFANQERKVLLYHISKDIKPITFTEAFKILDNTPIKEAQEISITA